MERKFPLTKNLSWCCDFLHRSTEPHRTGKQLLNSWLAHKVKMDSVKANLSPVAERILETNQTCLALLSKPSVPIAITSTDRIGSGYNDSVELFCDIMACIQEIVCPTMSLNK